MFELRVTTDQVGALCDALGLPPPVALEGSDVLRPDDADRESVFAAALEPLRAAGVTWETVEGQPEPPLATALRVLATPTTLVTVQCQRPGSAEADFFGLTGDAAAEHQPIGPDQHLIVALAPTEVLGRIATFCGLGGDPDTAAPTDAGPVAMAAADFLAAGQLLADGNRSGATSLLRGTGTDASIGQFLDALGAARSTSQVTVTFLSGASRIEGTTTAWLDGGGAGLWRMPTLAVSSPFDGDRSDGVELHRTTLRAEPVRAADLLAEITDGVPALT